MVVLYTAGINFINIFAIKCQKIDGHFGGQSHGLMAVCQYIANINASPLPGLSSLKMNSLPGENNSKKKLDSV